ncbi:MAG TPA: 2-isopropylmalate synthase [Bacillota bacterium]|nr:2-isopropylmalate synthase [Clostridiales bacterium]HPT85106.1 2-isopropylmalate synthase [Bacillota bacterium]
MRMIKIFDTTLRDGEQSPGCSMNINEKIEMARQLEALGVDVIEAGFAASSQGDYNSVKAIAKEIKNCVVASLARSLPQDIDSAWGAVKYTENPRLHIFIATSPIHMEYKLRKTPDEVYEQAVEMTKYAKKYCSDVEFSAEDASRSDRKFLKRVFEGVIKAGATTINVPDTVGYVSPSEMADLIKWLRENVEGMDKVTLSVHCHNDLGLAVANSLAAILAGAEQVECTVNGIGERAGNAALEEIVMNLKTRRDFYGADTRIDNTQIYKTSRMLSQITGVRIPPNKAIVGDNAFAHESGIHQHGVLANSLTYEIMTPESIGLSRSKMVLGKHSGRHAFTQRLRELGFNVNLDVADSLFKEFKALADKKKTVSDRDIEALVRRSLSLEIPEAYKLERYVINTGNTITPTSSVTLVKSDGTHVEEVAIGFGPVDASFKAINMIVGLPIELEDYSIEAVTGGRDAQGEVSVKISSNGKTVKGYGLSTDILEASILAYVNAINNLIYESERTEKSDSAEKEEAK